MGSIQASWFENLCFNRGNAFFGLHNDKYIKYSPRKNCAHIVPEVIITKNCRLHNQLFACNDFCGQRATTIYCGPAYKF